MKVKAAVLNPENGFNVDRTLTKDDVQRLIKVTKKDSKLKFGFKFRSAALLLL